MVEALGGGAVHEGVEEGGGGGAAEVRATHILNSWLT